MKTFDGEAMGKVLSWRQLRDFCDSLPDEWLDQPVKVAVPMMDLENRTFSPMTTTERLIYAGPSPHSFVFAQAPSEVTLPEGGPLLMLEITTLLDEEDEE